MLSVKSYFIFGANADIWRRTLLVVPLVLCIMLSTGEYHAVAQEQSSSTASGSESAKMSFDVLEVKTGSGSKAGEASGNTITSLFGTDASQAAEKLPAGDDTSQALGGTQADTTVTAEASPAAEVLSQTQKEEEATEILGLAQKEGDDLPEKPMVMVPLGKALVNWHNQTMAQYNFNISALSDPFVPIKAVRIISEEDLEEEEIDESLPAHLRMELHQLKLVAITTLSGRVGTALASFEDATKTSYILRQGDRIGRHQGRIIRIDPSQVIIEEFPKTRRDKEAESRVTVLALDTLANVTGLTRSAEGNVVKPDTE